MLSVCMKTTNCGFVVITLKFILGEHDATNKVA